MNHERMRSALNLALQVLAQNKCADCRVSSVGPTIGEVIVLALMPDGHEPEVQPARDGPCYGVISGSFDEVKRFEQTVHAHISRGGETLGGVAMASVNGRLQLAQSVYKPAGVKVVTK